MKKAAYHLKNYHFLKVKQYLQRLTQLLIQFKSAWILASLPYINSDDKINAKKEPVKRQSIYLNDQCKKPTLLLCLTPVYFKMVSVTFIRQSILLRHKSTNADLSSNTNFKSSNCFRSHKNNILATFVSDVILFGFFMFQTMFQFFV